MAIVKTDKSVLIIRRDNSTFARFTLASGKLSERSKAKLQKLVDTYGHNQAHEHIQDSLQLLAD